MDALTADEQARNEQMLKGLGTGTGNIEVVSILLNKRTKNAHG